MPRLGGGWETCSLLPDDLRMVWAKHTAWDEEAVRLARMGVKMGPAASFLSGRACPLCSGHCLCGQLLHRLAAAVPRSGAQHHSRPSQAAGAA